ncbi:16S rRNA (adenine(1518)-N(6)/adenine(1519)-N(6))-dimethyltransferase RsmA [Chloroflexota bacterium]
MGGHTTMSQVKDLLRRNQLKADKHLGQHFLVDRGILKSIAAAANLTNEDTVVEVGPGTGLLTREIALLAGNVIAVELDTRMVALLSEELADATNVTVVHGDILRLPPTALLDTHAPANTHSYKVVANLPYYITSPVLRHFLLSPTAPSTMVVMVQQEVGRAIAAKPGDMSLLSVMIQTFAQPTAVKKVSARSFHPPPKVDSMVLRLEVAAQPPIPREDAATFTEFVAAGFRAPRKQIRNSLCLGLQATREHVEPLLAQANVDPVRRPEMLTIDEWVLLWQAEQESHA